MFQNQPHFFPFSFLCSELFELICLIIILYNIYIILSNPLIALASLNLDYKIDMGNKNGNFVKFVSRQPNTDIKNKTQ